MKRRNYFNFWIFTVFALSIDYSYCGKTFSLLSHQGWELEIQADPYYSAGDLIIPLTGDAVSKIQLHDEKLLYQGMLSHLHKPRFLLVELSWNPLPFTGAWLEQEQPGVYQSAEIREHTNLIKMLTTGFDEPAALSLFWGNVVDFISEGGVTVGKGYAGYLISVGNYHLQKGFVPDLWAESEVKLKGEYTGKLKTLAWSFRIGAKFHRHTQIRDRIYIALRRDRTDFNSKSSLWDPLRNSFFEYRVDMDFRQFKFARYLLSFGKKIPINQSQKVFSLSGGILREVVPAHSGELLDVNKRQWSFFVRPNIQF